MLWRTCTECDRSFIHLAQEQLHSHVSCLGSAPGWEEINPETLIIKLYDVSSSASYSDTNKMRLIGLSQSSLSRLHVNLFQVMLEQLVHDDGKHAVSRADIQQIYTTLSRTVKISQIVAEVVDYNIR